MPAGIFIVNKPQGLTSHDVVDCVRKSLKIKRVGHAGTLDPLATGVLIILVGKATKFFNKFSGMDKEYVATVTLGKVTTTGDCQGGTKLEQNFSHITEAMVSEALNSFLGEQEQVPPMFSAVKYKGKKLYQFARRGIEVPRKPRKINIKELKLMYFKPPDVEIYLRCSKGTYVRKLAEDIGEKLGCGGCVSKIERVGIGEFNIKDAITIDKINESYLKPWKN
ncbi:MAG: tRNA pseudouridine(55) synthase TruB [Candidatus Omnitrophica bacterium]|nr:tRNA pseudouridine(55) synthase TruB [Candidatus Omnitrophota bacterium]